MLELNFIRTHRDQVINGLQVRNAGDETIAAVDEILELDNARKAIQTELDEANASRNQLSKEIGTLFKSGQADLANEKKGIVNDLKNIIGGLEAKLNDTKSSLQDKLFGIPNVPHPSVPSGHTDDDNEVVKDWTGELPDLGPDAKPHWELTELYPVFDLQLGTKIAGSGFPVFRGKGARLQRALIAFFLDEAHKAGYEEFMPPLLVNEDTARATGQLPDKEGQMYYVDKDDLYLIPTAEVPITNIYRNVILTPADLPIKLTGHTPCFRREAGSYGAHVRGLNRVHQFDKVEIVQITHPDHSYQALDEMVKHVEGLLEKLGLPYRILRLCGGDLGFTSALTYDFEVFSAAQQRWLEVSSVSNFETYQSNRLKLRFKEGKQNILAHTLNGSALALARIVASIMENYQVADGIMIPEVLRSYTGFDKIEGK